MQEIKLTMQELQKISQDFRMVANRLLRTRWTDGKSNLKRFINHIDANSIINEFIQEHNHYEFSIESIMNNCPYLYNPIPDRSDSEEISFLYQLLKYGLQNYDHYSGYLDFASNFCGPSSKAQTTIDKFNSTVVLPLYNYIENYLSKLYIDIKNSEDNKIIIQIQGNIYGSSLGTNLNEININKSTNIQAGRDAIGNISRSEVSGLVTNTVISHQNQGDTKMSESYQSKYDQRNANNQFVDTATSGSNVTFTQNNYTPEQKQNLVKAAEEIQQLLKQLETDNPSATEAEQISHIEDNTTPKFQRRAASALKAGGETAIDEFILDNKYLKVIKSTIKGWIQVDS